MNWIRIERATHADMVVFWLIPNRSDCRLLRYKTGAEFPAHTDVLEGYAQYRLNIVLRQGEGGEFWATDPIWQWWRFNLFRSDTSQHGVLPVTKGPRYVLTFGWAIKQKEQLHIET